MTTKSTRDVGGGGPEKEFLEFGPGDGGGDAMICGPVASTKKEYEMSLEMQSKLAIISFSLRVSQANRKGSNRTRGSKTSGLPVLIISKARCVASFRGEARLASFDWTIVSKAEVIRTRDTVCPCEIVRDLLCLVKVVLEDLEVKEGDGERG